MNQQSDAQDNSSEADPPGIIQFQCTRRNLPHWEEPGKTYFLTWRTATFIVLEPSERAIVLSSILHWDQSRWIVYVTAIMPDHVHVLVQLQKIPDAVPVAFYSLKSLVHSVKSYSAHQINRLRNRKGVLWLDERYDRIVRTEQELWEKWQYVRDNPVKSNLARTPEEYPWFYQRSGFAPRETP